MDPTEYALLSCGVKLLLEMRTSVPPVVRNIKARFLSPAHVEYVMALDWAKTRYNPEVVGVNVPELCAMPPLTTTFPYLSVVYALPLPDRTIQAPPDADGLSKLLPCCRRPKLNLCKLHRRLWGCKLFLNQESSFDHSRLEA